MLLRVLLETLGEGLFMDQIRVIVLGAAGRMGKEVVRAVCSQQDMKLVAAVDHNGLGRDAGSLAGIEPVGAAIAASLSDAIAQGKPEVSVDFSLPASVMANARATVGAKVATVIGASGLTEENLTELAALCEQQKTPAFYTPNFAIGAVLMMQFAAQVARYMEAVEIIELHHATKVDSPSATAARTARLITQQDGSKVTPHPSADHGPARGTAVEGIPIHSVRLPGLVAHQEVIFGGLGQTLTIRHDSTGRESFMPGVLLAIRKVRSLRGLTVGLEKIL
jgi:4-hydroxy-tetrahydrodipicolinate reductase